jgi:hypothetical protein
LPSENDPSLQPAALNLTPGSEYGPEARGFQGIPGIARAANGRLWSTWYAGAKTEAPDNYVVLATSADDGQTWSEVKAVIAPEGDVRAYDPTIWIDPQGKLWWFYAQSYLYWDGRSGVWAVTTEDPENENPKWSEPRRLVDGIMMNKPTVLANGDWLLPASIWAYEPTEGSVKPGGESALPKPGAHAYRTRDQGKTFEYAGGVTVPNHSADEHMIVERKDGSWWMLVRNKDGIVESVSTDEGKTWPKVVKSAIPHIVTRFFIRRIKSGKLLLVKHNPSMDRAWLAEAVLTANAPERSHLTAYLSDDDGKTWAGGLLLDERQRVSYPDGDQADDGRIFITYDFDRRGAREILFAVFTEEDVLAGKLVSEGARLRAMINKTG